MRGALAIYRRELAGMFLTPLAWVVLCIALVVNGGFFLVYMNETRGDVHASLQLTFGGGWVFWATLVFLPPLLTMRLISEESRSGMLEFLLTAPVTDAAVVCGKFLAAATVMAMLWGLLLACPLTVQYLGTAPDWPAVLGGLFGSVLASALFCGIGVLCSALTGTPSLAAFFAFIGNLVFLMLPFLRTMTQSEWIHALIERVDIIGHFQRSFLLGMFDTAQIVFLLAWTGLFVFLAVRMVEMRRWR